MSQLPEDEQNVLLQIAREAVHSHLRGLAVQTPSRDYAALNENRSLFVSIHCDDELRGCIGTINPSGPLHRVAAECAINAAVSDPRFAPLTLNELGRVTFEISLLSPMEQVRSEHEIEVGRHGLLITKMHARGLLLPQVPTDHGWDRNRFLSELCRKAGLRPDDWKTGATIYRFTAQVIAERNSQAA